MAKIEKYRFPLLQFNQGSIIHNNKKVLDITLLSLVYLINSIGNFFQFSNK